MSFSTELKKEISELGNLSNKEAVRYELIGYLISSNISEEKNKIKFSTENEYNINRFSRLLSNMEINNYDITVQGNLFVIRFNKNMIEKIKTTNNIKDRKDLKLCYSMMILEISTLFSFK